MKTTTTPLGKAEQLSDNLIKVTTLVKKGNDVELVRQHIGLIEEHFGTDIYYLSDTRDVQYTTVAVRKYLAKNVKAQAVAVLIKSGTAAMLANLFISFGKPLYPTKLFKEEADAIAWLVEQGAEAPKK
ncbi:hypothetical protein [Saprospira grandis]|uniref:DUF7793 domain-containing protein n=1 Tax=Saprospira grandis (strain Lewin) TaxID=984262 RepID=H6L0G1_SAPGL|nr:hypothetical protein [Saprospira grandis]AFC23391.1 hypothetical protein SGRA_0652 [Saprospira grandis str. Lewin]